MKKNINIRNLIIVMLCITIILMGVGFAFLAMRLEKISNEVDTFDVSITKVEAQTAIKGGLIDPIATKELLDDGKTVKFKGMVYRPKGMPDNEFVPGRMAMTCCADDTAFIGYTW